MALTALQWRSKKVILATGVRDLIPSIEGFEECERAGNAPGGGAQTGCGCMHGLTWPRPVPNRHALPTCC